MPAVESVFLFVSVCAYMQVCVEERAYLATLHSEGLAGTCLAVGKYADVVSIGTALCELRDLLKDLGLSRMGLENLGKCPEYTNTG